MVSFRLGEKRSIGAAGNAASGHKMFIAAERNLSAASVEWRKARAVTRRVLKCQPRPEWAAVLKAFGGSLSNPSSHT